jgi:hypothetical protein
LAALRAAALVTVEFRSFMMPLKSMSKPLKGDFGIIGELALYFLGKLLPNFGENTP